MDLQKCHPWAVTSFTTAVTTMETCRPIAAGKKQTTPTDQLYRSVRINVAISPPETLMKGKEHHIHPLEELGVVVVLPGRINFHNTGGIAMVPARAKIPAWLVL